MRSLSLPQGVFSLLPVFNKADNFALPTGPWNLDNCKQRRATHSQLHPPAQSDSAVEDDEEADQDDNPNEFLVPFFISLPPPSTTSLPEAQPAARTRPTSRAASFSRLTPLPSLRSSSPTPSYPARAPSSSSSSPDAPPQPIGFLRPKIIKALALDNAKMVSMSCKPVWAFYPPLPLPAPPPKPMSRRNSSFSRSRRGSLGVTPLTTSGTGTPTTAGGGEAQLKDILEGLKLAATGRAGEEAEVEGTWAVGFEDWINEEGLEARKEHMDRIARGWKMAGMFPDQLGGWRNELYSIYGPAPPFSPAVTTSEADEENGFQSSPLPGSNVVLEVERAACSLFGLATFGVHLTGYVEEVGQPLKIWVPKRSATKQTWPSHLDNTVAGGITARASAYETVVRECAEEASLPEDFVEEHVRSTGVISYTFRTKEGWVQPEVQYVYDLKFPSSATGDEVIVPKTNVDDGEVESFSLLTVEEVVQKMCEGEFKPNCSLVLMDFFIRHGYLTSESDSRFLEIATRLRSSLILPGPA